MSTLILAQKRIFSYRVTQFIFVERFIDANQQGKVTAIFLAVLSLGVVVYLAGLFASFYLGFGIQQVNSQYQKLDKSVLENVLTLQSKLSFLDDHQKAVLQSMEKVSLIKYIQPENVAMQHTRVNP